MFWVNGGSGLSWERVPRLAWADTRILEEAVGSGLPWGIVSD